MASRGLCTFCRRDTVMTREHVLSEPILRLMGVTRAQAISWTEGGTPRIWGGRTDARTLDDLTIDCVCRDCNSEWMQALDHQFAGDIRWWAKNPAARLGENRLAVVRRYMSKLLLIVRAGEPWAKGDWIRGEGPEPEFMPLSIRTDGPTIQSARYLSADDLSLRVHLAASCVRADARSALTALPISADGVPDNNKASRLSAGISLTLRSIGVRLYCVHSWLDQRWTPVWPPNVGRLHGASRARGLTSERDDPRTNPRLVYAAGGDVPDVVGVIELALRMATDRARAGA